MTEPLDFTNVGRQTQTPPPRPAARPPRGSRRSPRAGDPWWKSTRFIVAVVVVAAIVIGVLVVRSRSGDSAKTKAMHQATYCQLSLQFNLLASSTGAASASGAFDGSPEAMAAFAAQVKPLASQMRALAPSGVNADIDTVLSAVGKAAKGDRAEISSPSFTSARNGLFAYQSTACPTGGESGEG